MKIAPPSRGAHRAPREGKMILKLFFKIYKLPTQGRQDFKPLNLWDGSVMKKEIITNSPDETKLFAQEFADQLKPGAILALTGNLGSGKTCFAKGIIEELTGTKENFQGSPTFALIQEYKASQDASGTVVRVYHFDFYRVKNAVELFQIGWQEYISDETGVCIIEWADLFPEILPAETKWIKFISEGNDKRRIGIRNP